MVDRNRLALNQACSPVIENLETRQHMDASTVQTLPFNLDFSSAKGDVLDKDGRATGYTRVQANTLGNEYRPGLITLDTAAGLLKLTTLGTTTTGTNSGTDNTATNVLETQFDGTTSGFAINARLKGSLGYMNAAYEQGGITFGPDQDNYVKLVAIRTTAGNYLQFKDEQNNGGTLTSSLGSTAEQVSIGSFSSITTLDMRLVGDAATGKVTAFYAIDGGSFMKLAQELTLSGNKKNAFFNAASRAGILAFSKNNAAPITVAFDSFGITAGTSTANRPSVTLTRPGDGASDIRRDIFIAADVNLPNLGGGVDETTVNSTAVKLFKTATGALVAGNPNTTGGGDAIVFTPTAVLEANTQYTFLVTDGVKDSTGVAFIPYTSTFTTGTAGANVDSSIAFEKVALPSTQGNTFTGVTFGPDGKLYATTITGQIIRYGVNADGTLDAGYTINTITAAEGAQRMVLSIVFAPGSTADNLVAYVSHSVYAFENAPNWTTKITKLTGANLQTATDVVVGLPRSYKDHQGYQLQFGPDGALYMNQSSMSAMGSADSVWGNRPETLLSASILRVDLSKISGTVNVRTDGASPYNPYASGAPVTLYATGLRSAYDILFHSNGKMYSATNGSAAGGRTPSGGGAPSISNVGTQDDYLFNVVAGGYYGHPNPLRAEYVLNGGNPTSGVDPAEVVEYPVGTQPTSTYKGFAYDFGKNYSADGMIEFKGNAFGGKLNGKILIARYSGGDDILVLTPDANGNIVSAQAGYAGLTGFVDPLDIIQNPATGFLYVAEYGGQRLTLLKPAASTGVASVNKTALQLSDFTTAGGHAASSPAAFVRLTNTGTGMLSLPTDALTVTGTNASEFKIQPGFTLPSSLAAGAYVDVPVVFTATAVGIRSATLSIKSDSATLTVSLRGLGIQNNSGGANEPSLQRILDLYGLPINVGDKDSSTTDLYTSSAPLQTPNDEVVMPRLVKAGGGPVYDRSPRRVRQHHRPIDHRLLQTRHGQVQQTALLHNPQHCPERAADDQRRHQLRPRHRRLRPVGQLRPRRLRARSARRVFRRRAQHVGRERQQPPQGALLSAEECRRLDDA